ncbi:putative neugrin-like protein DDB_G0288135 [Contarinia nasturtii]|uniref:putative neugrin-like protein DDB_G0288135 n=1 Tax=Contarinia nasturtii TaxID=265458 RepID=UPI0012D4658A|nr:putative neugrin-like protein DDB_G0288135 [Contarinia nasturtii]
MLRAILPIARNSSCFFVRTYRTNNKRPKDQAGVRIQRKIFKNTEVEMDPEVDPDLTYEADFTQLNRTHKEHEAEMEVQKEQTKYYTIKSKYFKSEKQPNFLTWAEKEQIRQLNQTAPEEWTPERLSESFPAVEDVIIKVLKAKWKPLNLKRIQMHDESVKRNWELLKTNQMKDLDPDIKNHLKKFSNRNFDSIQNAQTQKYIEFEFPKPKTTEYLQIISTCQRRQTKDGNDAVTGGDKTNPKLEQNQTHATRDLSLVSKPQLKIPKNIRKEDMTYDKLMESTNVHLNKPQHEELDEDPYLSVSLLKDPNIDPHNDVPSIKEDPKHTYSDEFNHESKDDNVVDLTLNDMSSSKKIVKYETKTKSLASIGRGIKIEPLQHTIHIPQNLRKRGSIYKLHDCFYDDRGAFMYRVPGLK